ncbi:virulence protein [Phosphitispora sp. TUW77]|uniref:virulence protein n=1 Tax=Phosphitispora sp. TUW77 TaxID=3152361 RepID=UPI003AB15216
MELKYNVTGARRKELVSAVSELVGEAMSYKGAPTFAYEVGPFSIDKEGTLSYPVETGGELVEMVMERLSERGFDFEEGEIPDLLTIEMPLEGFTEESLSNLEKLIASKAKLIQRAIGAESLPIERTESTLKFPWFKLPVDSDEVAAYSRFVGALCAAAKEQKRVTAREKEVDNEKFAFRVFLIRLGFVGDEYKTARKILLRSLSGNSAFKNGRPEKANADCEVCHE